MAAREQNINVKNVLLFITCIAVAPRVPVMDQDPIVPGAVQIQNKKRKNNKNGSLTPYSS